MINSEVHGLKLSRDVAKSMFPDEYEIGEAFEDKLQALIAETLDANKGKGQKAFGAITATMTMELVKMFAVVGTDPISVIKTFSDVIMSTYQRFEQLKEEHDKAK